MKWFLYTSRRSICRCEDQKSNHGPKFKIQHKLTADKACGPPKQSHSNTVKSKLSASAGQSRHQHFHYHSPSSRHSLSAHIAFWLLMCSINMWLT